MTTTTKSSGAYAPDKALAHPDRLQVLREGGQPNPTHLHLVISDLCNLDCPGCAYRMSGYSSNQLFTIIDGQGNADHNPNRMLDEVLVRQVLDDCLEMGVKAVEFTGGGEPTVHPHVWTLISYAQSIGLETALITNGLRMRERVVEQRYEVRPPLELAVRGQWLRFSIDAATGETYERVRPGVGGARLDAQGRSRNFNMACGNLGAARLLRDELKTDCVIGAGFVVQRENWHELYEAVQLFKNLGADNVRISGLFTPDRDRYFDGWREAAEDLERKAIADFDDPRGERGLPFRVYGRFHEKVADLAAPPDYERCAYQHFTTYLGADGWLYRCCVQSYNLVGRLVNVAEAGGLKAAWESHVKQARMANFNAARACTHCQFNDRNRAINAVVDSAEPIPPAPAGLVHPNFV